MDSHRVGTVTGLYRYPVKSMRGEAITATQVGWPGLDGDRRYAFVRSENPSGFPWLTARDVATLLCYTPYFADAAQPATSAVRVRTPDGRDLALESADLRAELAGLYGQAVHLMKLNRGTFDSVGVSLLSRETLAALGDALDGALDERRFRPNIMLETADGRPYAEESWIGGLLVFGDRADSARIRANTRIERCMMINLDPERAVQDPAILRQVARTRDTCTAVGGSTEAPGSIRVGDPIYLLRA